jgi:hypothetical protein
MLQDHCRNVTLWQNIFVGIKDKGTTIGEMLTESSKTLPISQLYSQATSLGQLYMIELVRNMPNCVAEGLRIDLSPVVFKGLTHL